MLLKLIEVEEEYCWLVHEEKIVFEGDYEQANAFMGANTQYNKLRVVHRLKEKKEIMSKAHPLR